MVTRSNNLNSLPHFQTADGMIKVFVFSLAIIGLGHSALAQDGWVLRSPMPEARAGIAAAAHGGKIYVLGGRKRDGAVVDTVQVYDPATAKWSIDFPPMPVAVENAAAVIHNNRLFVLGGQDKNGQVLNKVHFFDFDKGKWETFDGMHQERQGHAALVLKGVLYALGGSNREAELMDNVEYYDAKRQKWREADEWELIYPSASMGAVVLADSAFAIGGFASLGPLGFMQRYYPGLGTAGRASLHVPRGGLAAVVYHDRIFAIGGRDANDRVLPTVEIYNASENTWQEGVSLKIARENFAAVVVQDSLYVFGGSSINGDIVADMEMFYQISDGIQAAIEPPREFFLEQNYPNPFNAGTTIRFHLGASCAFAPLRLSIFSIDGRLMRTLVNKPLAAGENRIAWDGTDARGKPVASGVYIYVLQVGTQRQSKKMSLIQ